MDKNSETLLSKIDILDDLIYEFYNDQLSDFLIINPEYRFLLINAILSGLCEINLATKENNIDWLVELLELKSKKLYTNANKISDLIKSIVNKPTYFAASYWSPIDYKRHTISHCEEKSSKNEEDYARACALLFYILTLKAPPKFHSAINYIATKAPRKNGLHTSYKIEKPESEFQFWWHFPMKSANINVENIHEEYLKVSGFREAIERIRSKGSKKVLTSLNIIMDNLDDDLVNNEIKVYKDIYMGIINSFDKFEIPSNLIDFNKNIGSSLNSFFGAKESDVSDENVFDMNQVFFLACTHLLYKEACPTELFYTFPVRVSDSCSVFTLGVKEELNHEQIMAMFHIIKSIYYHGLVIDYHARENLEREVLAHSAIHIMRPPLHLAKYLPDDILYNLSKGENFSEKKNVLDQLESEFKKFNELLRWFNFGLKSLTNFLELKTVKEFRLYNTILNSKNLFNNNFINEINNIDINIDDKLKEYKIKGVETQISFIFGELFYNSLKAKKTQLGKKPNKEDGVLVDISIYLDNKNENIIISFKDNGPGIEPVRKSKIFKYREKRFDSENSGMGLYLIKSYLNKINGKIYECGEFGKGALFIIKLKINHDT